MLPEVCALRGGVCALSDEPCAAPCAALGFARAIRHMGYQHWTLQQVLERLCNPREYASDDEYARLLSDDAVVERQRAQLSELQERREQLDMMFEWQRGLLDIDAEAVEMLRSFWDELVPGLHLSKVGEANLRKLMKTFGLDEVLAAIGGDA